MRREGALRPRAAIRTFRGPTEGKVKRRISEELGASAVILTTRRVRRKGLWGLVGRTVIEMDAVNPADLRKAPPPPPEPARAAAGPPRRGALPAEPISGGAAGAHLGEILRELQGLKHAFADVCGRIRGPGVPDLSAELQETHRILVENEVAQDLAATIVRDLNERLSREALRSPELLRAALRKVLEEKLAVSGPISPASASSRCIAFVGPTGVGKTTTIAKIAAQMRLRDKLSVGLITIDTYRLAAVEQLRSFANIVSVPIRVADSPSELRRAVKDFSGHHVTLIDTTGRSHQDRLKLNELKMYLDAAQPHEVHLVMSLTANPRNLDRVVEQFLPLGVTQVVFTKLDEVDSFGLLLNVMSRVNKSLSYVTFGQSVPDDIEAGRPERLARLILREESLRGDPAGITRGIA